MKKRYKFVVEITYSGYETLSIEEVICRFINLILDSEEFNEDNITWSRLELKDYRKVQAQCKKKNSTNVITPVPHESGGQRLTKKDIDSIVDSLMEKLLPVIGQSVKLKMLGGQTPPLDLSKQDLRSIHSILRKRKGATPRTRKLSTKLKKQ